MIVYDPLWETMKRKQISQYRLIKHFGFSSGQINRLKKNMYVSTHTIGILCTILDCAIPDVMEFRLENYPDNMECSCQEEKRPEE